MFISKILLTTRRAVGRDMLKSAAWLNVCVHSEALRGKWPVFNLPFNSVIWNSLLDPKPLFFMSLCFLEFFPMIPSCFKLEIRMYIYFKKCKKNSSVSWQRKCWNEAAEALWHKLRKVEISQSLHHREKNFSSKNREKKCVCVCVLGGRGHLVSIKKIKCFTLRILQTSLLLGRRPRCSLHHHPVDITLKASNGCAAFLNQKLIVVYWRVWGGSC